MDNQNVDGSGQQEARETTPTAISTTPAAISTTPVHQLRGSANSKKTITLTLTSRNTGCCSQQNRATLRSMRREEWVTVP